MNVSLLMSHLPPKELTREELMKNSTHRTLSLELIRERARKMRERRRLYKDDAKSLFHIATQLSKERVYKPFKAPVETGPKEMDSLPQSEELFMFGLQTKRQAKLMAEHFHKIVVVDETHGTNQYKYQLLNVASSCSQLHERAPC